MPALAKELKKLESQGIIERTDKGTSWLHPIVAVPKKDGGIRLCVDFKQLNKHIYRPVNPQPTPKEVIQRIPTGMKYFAVFDALKGYHQIPLEEDSKDLTTFITPFGQYRYNRLPFGLNLAGDIFTSRYGKAIDHVEGMSRIVEDSLVYAPDVITLERRTKLFLEAVAKSGITLNKSKIQYGVNEAQFGGFIVSKEGYTVNPKLMEALQKFPVPANRTDLKSFFGLANQVGSFRTDLSQALTPLKDLLSTKNIWQWLPHHQVAFEKARDVLAKTSELNFYNPSNPIRVSADASRLHGLGFVMKQRSQGMWIPVQAGSRMLSQAERNYAMIELEMLAIQWACQKCENFLYGLSHFEITTDHKPLILILNEKCLNQIENKRLQRMRSKLDHLNYTVTFVKGSLNFDADALSRAPIDKPEDEDEPEVYETTLQMVHEIVQDNMEDATTPTTWAEIIKAAEDGECAELRNYALNGWPQKDQLLSSIMPYWSRRDEIWINDEGLLVMDSRLVIPKNLRRFVLDRLKALHLGPVKTYQRARTTLWWPQMTSQIKDSLKECLPCQVHAPSVPQTIDAHHEPAERPMQAIHADICEETGQQFLISVDQYSGWLWIHYLGKRLPSSEQLIDVFLAQFQTGLPDKLYTDGATMFTSKRFKEFTQAWNIDHRTSSPHHHQSNGIAEEAVKEAKKIIRANVTHSLVNRQGIMAALLGYHNTPKRDQMLAPSQKLFGRYLRDTLPASNEQLTKLWNLSRTEKERHARKIPDTQPKFRWENFKVGDLVYVQNPNNSRWEITGEIVQRGNNQYEWIVRTDANAVYRRNHRFLRHEEKKAWLQSSTPLMWGKPTDIEAPKAAPQPNTEKSAPVQYRSILRPAREIRVPARYIQTSEVKNTRVRFSAPEKSDTTPHINTRILGGKNTLREATVFNPSSEFHAQKAREGADMLAYDVLEHGGRLGRLMWYWHSGDRWKRN